MMKYLLFTCFKLAVACCIAQEATVVIPIGHSGGIMSAAYSYDGRYVITSSVDHTARIWETRTGKIIKVLKGHTQYLEKAIFSPNGNFIATAGRDGLVIIWDGKTGQLLHELKAHNGTVAEIAFSNNSSKLVTASWDGQAYVWNCSTGRLLLDLKGHEDKIIKVLFSNNDQQIITAAEDDKINIWDAATGKIVRILRRENHLLTDVALSNNNLWLASNYLDGTVMLWEALTGKLLKTLKLPEPTTAFDREGIVAVDFHPNNNLLLTASNGGNLFTWQRTTGSLLQKLTGHTRAIKGVHFSRDGKLFTSFSEDSTAAVWETTTLKKLGSIKHAGEVSASVFDNSSTKLLTASFDHTARISEATTGKKLADLNSKVSASYYANPVFSADNKSIFLPSQQGIARRWDFCQASTQWASSDSGNALSALVLSADGKYVATAAMKETVYDKDTCIKWYNAQDGKLLGAVQGQYYFSSPISFANKSSMLAYASPTGITCRDLNTGLSFELPRMNTSYFKWLKFSQNDSLLTAAAGNDDWFIWNVHTKALLRIDKNVAPGEQASSYNSRSKIVKNSVQRNYDAAWLCDFYTGDTLQMLRGHRHTILKSVFNDRSDKLVTVGADSSVRLYNAQTGDLIKEWPRVYSDDGLVTAKFFDDDRKLLLAWDTILQVWDVSTNTLYKKLTSSSSFASTGFSADGRYMLNASYDAQVQVWDLQTLSVLYSIINFEGTDAVALRPDGHYKASLGAARQLYYVTPDLKIITFDQLDLQYNRPDKVLEAAGCADATLITSYRNAYFKRIKKLGYDSSVLVKTSQVPEADFVGRDNIRYDQRSGKLTLHVKGNGKTQGLQRFHLRINEVPLFGLRGIAVQQNKSNLFDTTLTLQLSPGENSIEASITNVKGIESYRMPLLVNYKAAVPVKENTYFIGIGIDEFADSKYNLRYSAKDIRDLAKKMKEKYAGSIRIDTLLNKNVTTSNIKALKKILLQTTINDRVIIAYSGHGLLGKSYDYYLSTYAIDFVNPEQAGLAYEELENLIDRIPARKKLLLIDACHSGEVDKEELEKIKVSVAGTQLGGAKGVVPLVIAGSRKTGINNSFSLMQDLFVNVGRSTGATIISAAAGTQFALERGDLKNGVFTYAILELMQQKRTASIATLKEYVNKRVPELTKGQQVPTSRTGTIHINWNIW